jgi:hypothetical protein
VNCRFLAMDSAAPPPPLLNLDAKGADIPCAVFTNAPSPVTACFARESIVNFITTADRKPAATATIPASMDAAILVFMAAAKAPDALPWRVFVLEDTPRNLPDGGALVVNFLPQDLRIVIGEYTITLHPEKSHSFARPEKRDAFNMAALSFDYQQGDAWRTASESKLRFLPGLRYLIFASTDPVSSQPRIATYQDFKPVARPPANH